MRRDSYQRRAYALRRMSLAVDRLSQARSPDEREKARYWKEMWSAVSGIRQFKLGNGGGTAKNKRVFDVTAKL